MPRIGESRPATPAGFMRDSFKSLVNASGMAESRLRNDLLRFRYPTDSEWNASDNTRHFPARNRNVIDSLGDYVQRIKRNETIKNKEKTKIFFSLPLFFSLQSRSGREKRDATRQRLKALIERVVCSCEYALAILTYIFSFVAVNTRYVSTRINTCKYHLVH